MCSAECTIMEYLVYQVSNNWIGTTHHLTKINTSVCLSSVKIFTVISKTVHVRVLQDKEYCCYAHFKTVHTDFNDMFYYFFSSRKCGSYELRVLLRITRYRTYYKEFCSETLILAFHELGFTNPFVCSNSASLHHFLHHKY